MLDGLGFDVGGIRVQYFASHQPPSDALPQNLIENLLGDVVVPESRTRLMLMVA